MELESLSELYKSHFPALKAEQIEQLHKLGELYAEWNSKINVISRKDIDQVYTIHILHSLLISKVISFVPNSKILDLGTGGGLPGLPLAIMFPKVNFKLVDGRNKKIIVVSDIIERLGLMNVTAQNIRAEELKGERFDFILSRAVAPIEKLYLWCQKLIEKKQINGLPNGLLCLKGGDLKEELSILRSKTYHEVFDLNDFVSTPYFESKKLVYVQM